MGLILAAFWLDFWHLIYIYFEKFNKIENNIICAEPEKVLQYLALSFF
jgi:hypothetical protein